MDFMRDYGQDVELVKQFFRDYTHVGAEDLVEPKYKERLTQIANRETQHIFVEISDLEHFNQDLANQVMRNTWRYTKIFYEALDEIIPTYKTRAAEAKDPMDVFIEQRLFVAERNLRGNSGQSGNSAPSQSNPSGGTVNVEVDGKYPPELLRRYEIYFKPTNFSATPIRDVRAETVGKFVTVRGIVTRTSDVKPKIVIVTYTCDLCGYESFQTVDGPEYTPLFECTSAVCKANKSIGRITSQTRGSKFVKCQEVKLQEHSDHVPTGHIPRTITVTIHGELTRSCTPGDHISVSGIFLPINPKGYRMRNHGNTADTYIEAHYITQMNKTEDDELSVEPMSNEEAALFIQGETNFLRKLSSSIAPEIFGHEKLKKALLLLLVGGVDKNTRGMKIRGNINICLMGDPGVAKSQLLAFIDRLATRSQYTTGRGSSGVGLTAAVLKDPITNELVLEGGALVLADQGICCIDEFDKMMDADRTAIHEVMEQQTVSIAKAGINTTLNARVSILAAANPAYGRINIHKSIPEQLQLPPALLSRFDLLWVIMDKADREKDRELGSHVLNIHKNPGEEPQTDHQGIDMKTMRRYISLCKTKNPIVPEDLTDILVNVYLKIREKGCTKKKQSDDALFTSPRSLLAIIRLSTALARLRLSEVVEQPDIEAAFDLYNDSWESVMGATSKSSLTAAGSILEIIKAELEDFNSMPLDRLYEVAARELKFTDNQVESALRELQEKDVVYFDHESVTLVS